MPQQWASLNLATGAPIGRLAVTGLGCGVLGGSLSLSDGTTSTLLPNVQLTPTMAEDFGRSPKNFENSQEYRPLARDEHEALLPPDPQYPKDVDEESTLNAFHPLPPFYAHPRSRLHVAVSFLTGIVACLIVQFLICAVKNSAPIPSHVHTQASEHAGSTEVHQFPPSKPTNAFPSLFPSDIGYAGPTPTGAEPGLVATAPAYPLHTGAPNLLAPTFPSKHNSSGKDTSEFDLFKHWGNLSPWFSVERGGFGLDSSPEAPDTCRVTALHFLHRHGARYPTSYGAFSPYFSCLRHSDVLWSFLRWSRQLLIPSTQRCVWLDRFWST